MQLSQAIEAPMAPARFPARTCKASRCCGREMQVLLRSAVLHADGSVEFQEALECNICGRRIL